MKKTIAMLAAVGITAFSVPNSFPVSHAANVEFRYTVDNGTATITGASGVSDVLDIPSKIDGLTVTDIADGFFMNSIGLTVVTLPDSLVSIGKKAFSNCAELTNV